MLNYRQLRVLLYRLKRIWGQPVTVRRPNANTHNVQTGVITRAYDEYEVKRAIVMPVTEARKFKYGLTFIAANKNFSYGAYYDQQSRFIIIEKLDLAIVPNADDNIQFRSKTYQIVEVIEYEDDRAFYLLVRRVTSAD